MDDIAVTDLGSLGERGKRGSPYNCLIFKREPKVLSLIVHAVGFLTVRESPQLSDA